MKVRDDEIGMRIDWAKAKRLEAAVKSEECPRKALVWIASRWARGHLPTDDQANYIIDSLEDS